MNSALEYRDKVIMKNKLNQHNIKTPLYAPIESSVDLIAFIQKYGYPVVLKPRKGFGK